MGVYGVGRDPVGRHRLTQAAHPPPAARKHPVAARSPNTPVAAPTGRPAGTKDGRDQTLRGSLSKSGPLDFATKNTFPFFFVGEEALVGVY